MRLDCNLDTLIRAAEALTPMSSETTATPGDYMLSNEDQHFLLVFIMGTYFGPDVKAENTKKSALQRIAEGLPEYTSNQLAGSELKMADAEQVYYYVLRKADESVVPKLSLLHQFFQGNLEHPAIDDPIVDHLQFPDLFPPHLHPQSYHRGQYKIIENVVFINNPEISFMKREDIERFKRLSGLEDLMLDRNAATYGGGEISSTIDDKTKVEGSNDELPIKKPSMNPFKREQANGHLKPEPLSSFSDSLSVNNGRDCSNTLQESNSASFITEEKEELEKINVAGPAMLLLSSYPTMQEWNNIVGATRNGIQFYGSIAERLGPLIGLVDIGECEDAYIFRVSLPGVSRNEDEFSCEVETDGRVMIKGVTVTGHKYVHKFSQVYEMQTQNLPPPGPFTVSFKLPGPVDPKEFTGNFGDDGILEGIVLKEK